MKHSKEDIENLLIEKISGYISPDDDLILQKYIEEDEKVREAWNQIQHKHTLKGEYFLNSLDENKAWENISHKVSDHKKPAVIVSYKRWVSVAAAVLIVVACFYLINQSGNRNTVAVNKAIDNPDIELTLADGRSVILNDSGYTVNVGVTELSVNKGKLDYKSSDKSYEWNTLSVPVKMNYNLVLSDGTQVWLNSTSSLRFPFNFLGNKREVYLEGEAYFKVAKNTEKSFIVHVGGSEVKVLGTSFNINHYGEEVVTSLVEGSVISSAGNDRIQLKPGFQSIYKASTGYKVEPFDVETVVSWMDGIFYFDEAPLKDISNVINRWFNVQVIIDSPKLHHLTFTGSIEKDKSLEIFINNLETTSGIKAQLVGNELHLR